MWLMLFCPSGRFRGKSIVGKGRFKQAPMKARHDGEDGRYEASERD